MAVKIYTEEDHETFGGDSMLEAIDALANDGAVMIFDRRSLDILAELLKNEVIGQLGRGESGLLEGFLEGNETNEPFWGTDDAEGHAINLGDVAGLILVLLAGTGPAHYSAKNVQRFEELLRESFDREVED